MRTRDDERRSVHEQVIGKSLRHALHGNACVDGGSSLRIRWTTNVSDDDEIRPRHKVLRVVAVHETNAPTLERRAHGRVKRDIRTGHDMPACLEKPGKRAHSRTGNTHEVHMHGGRA